MNYIKRNLIILLIVRVGINSLVATAAFANSQPDLKSPSAILMDAATGAILFEKKVHEKLEPASITKVMTLILVFEALEENKVDLNDKIKISERAWKTGGSQVFLAPGEEQALETLIKCIIVASGNDASVAVAEHIGGSYEGFVQMMNDKAKVLGMNDTSFKNPHGLSETGHESSAYDIAVMSRELVKHKSFFKWSSIWLDYLEHTDKKRDATMLANTNKLLGKYEGLDGIKTGFHSKAGHCFTGTAKRGDFRLISVVLNAENTDDRFTDTIKLMDYGFGHYDSVMIVKKDSIHKCVPVEKGMTSEVNIVAASDVSILSKKGEDNNITTKVEIPDKLFAPLKKGEKVGTLVVESDNELKGKIDLIVSQDVRKAGIFVILKRIFGRWLDF